MIDGWVQGAVRASRNSTTGPEIPLLMDLCTDLHIRMVKKEGIRPIPAHSRAHDKQLHICVCHYHAATQAITHKNVQAINKHMGSWKKTYKSTMRSMCAQGLTSSPIITQAVMSHSHFLERLHIGMQHTAPKHSLQGFVAHSKD